MSVDPCDETTMDFIYWFATRVLFFMARAVHVEAPVYVLA